eukprot:6196696-Pleurochrysis_carterae.AAC.2
MTTQGDVGGEDASMQRWRSQTIASALRPSLSVLQVWTATTTLMRARKTTTFRQFRSASRPMDL